MAREGGPFYILIFSLKNGERLKYTFLAARDKSLAYLSCPKKCERGKFGFNGVRFKLLWNRVMNWAGFNRWRKPSSCLEKIITTFGRYIST